MFVSQALCGISAIFPYWVCTCYTGASMLGIGLHKFGLTGFGYVAHRFLDVSR